ncbi:MAG TPA: ribonuclease HI family protein [Candidatus Saccharimonadales bacterium]|nr:ribonuclease HI family protein [Candidatus Saccharimonadales bacterium]
MNNPVDELVIYTDGGARGNPGPAASGFVIMTADEEVLEDGGEYLGVTTNNQAEYQAVKLALIAAKKYHPTVIRFKMDSELVVKQMNGVYKIKNRDLWPIHSFIKETAQEFTKVTYEHVRREFNKLADAKVNQILDAHRVL